MDPIIVHPSKAPLKRRPAGPRRLFQRLFADGKKLEKCVSNVQLGKASGDMTRPWRNRYAASTSTAYGGEVLQQHSDTFVARMNHSTGQESYMTSDFATDILRLYYAATDAGLRVRRPHLMINPSSVATADESWDEMTNRDDENFERDQSEYHESAMSVYFQTNDVQNLSAREVLEYACATRNMQLSDIQDSIRLANRLCQDLNIDAITQVEEFLVALNPEYVADGWPTAN